MILNALQRVNYRWFPKGSMAINHPDGLGVAYVEALKNGAYGVVAYRGTANKHSFNYSYKTREQAEQSVASWFESLTAHEKMVAQRRAETNKPHTFEVGDVVYNSWGYDQTNVDFYQVTRKTANFVWVRPIASKLVPDSGCGPMSGKVTPLPGEFQNQPEEKHKATAGYVCFKYGSGSKWDGRPKYCSWYA